MLGGLVMLALLIIFVFCIKFSKDSISRMNDVNITLKATITEVDYNLTNFKKYNSYPYIVVQYKNPDNELKTERLNNIEMLEYQVGEQIDIYYNQDTNRAYIKIDPNRKKYQIFKDKKFVLCFILCIILMIILTFYKY